MVGILSPLTGCATPQDWTKAVSQEKPEMIYRMSNLFQTPLVTMVTARVVQASWANWRLKLLPLRLGWRIVRAPNGIQTQFTTSGTLERSQPDLNHWLTSKEWQKCTQRKLSLTRNHIEDHFSTWLTRSNNLLASFRHPLSQRIHLASFRQTLSQRLYIPSLDRHPNHRRKDRAHLLFWTSIKAARASSTRTDSKPSTTPKAPWVLWDSLSQSCLKQYPPKLSSRRR